MNNFLQKIPALLSSKTSIFIYIFLFFYLVVFPIVCALIPIMKNMIPSDTIQLILGNYTNVLSALGASIAAGTGVGIHNKLKDTQKRHEVLLDAIQTLHNKIDKLEEKHSNDKINETKN